MRPGAIAPVRADLRAGDHCNGFAPVDHRRPGAIIRQQRFDFELKFGIGLAGFGQE